MVCRFSCLKIQLGGKFKSGFCVMCFVFLQLSVCRSISRGFLFIIEKSSALSLNIVIEVFLLCV